MDRVDIQAIKSAIENQTGTALLGIDGMIDEVWELIDSRVGPGDYKKMDNMITLGNAITERGTGGMAKERLLKRRVCGGFVCNTGRAVAKLGQDTTLLGMFGDEPRDSIFDEYNGLATLVSLDKPVYLHVLEFLDGKIMMPNLDHLINLSWAGIIEKLGMEKLTSLLNVDIVGVGYWSNMYDFDAILGGIVDICLANGKTKRVFHDFANLNKRTADALADALKTLAKENKRLPQTLSLNEHEGAILAKQLGVAYPEDVNNKASSTAVFESVKAMRDIIDIDELIVHTSHYAVVATANHGAAVSNQNYCDKPVKTTGAGDTFNGGYMVASLTDLDPRQRMVFANATTLCYVSTGNPPTKAELLAQLEKLAQ